MRTSAIPYLMLFVVLLAALSGLRTALAQEPTQDQGSTAQTTAAPVDSLDTVHGLIAEGKFREAERIARGLLAQTASTTLADSLRLAAVLDGLVHALINGPHVGAAETRQFAERTVAIRQAAQRPDDPDLAFSLVNLGVMHYKLGEYPEAESAYQRALAIRETAFGPDHGSVASCLNNLGALHWSQGQFRRAEPLFRRVVAIRERELGPDHPTLAINLNNLGMIYQYLGDYLRAEALFRRTQAILETRLGPRHPSVATIQNNLALLYHGQGQLARAEPLLQQSLAIREEVLGLEHPQVAEGLHNLGLLTSDQGRHHESEEFHQRAIALTEASLGAEHPTLSLSLNNLGVLYRRQGQYERAQPCFERALEITEKSLGTLHHRYASSLAYLAANDLSSGRIAAAEPRLERSLAVFEQILGPEHPRLATSLLNLARVHGYQGRYTEGIALLERAAQLFESARLRVGHGLERATFQEAPYPTLAAYRLLSGDRAGAWRAVERDRGRVLADLLMQGAQRPLDELEIARGDSLARLMDRLENQLSAQMPSTDAAVEPDAYLDSAWEIRLQMLQVQASWSRFQRDLAEKYPVAAGVTDSLQRVQAFLDPRAAILGWLDVVAIDEQSRSWAYVLRADGPVHWVELAGTEKSAEASGGELAAAWRLDLKQRPDTGSPPDGARDRFAAVRLHPVLPLLTGVDDLLVIPSGDMVDIPVESLTDDEGRYLGDRFAISYIPSATIWTWLREQGPRRSTAADPRAVLLVGDPPFTEAQLAAMSRPEPAPAAPAMIAAAAGSSLLREAAAGDPGLLALLPRLPGTRDEVLAIGALAGAATILIGPEATEQELIRLARQGELVAFCTLHLATHAFADPQRPERSSFILSQVGLPDPLQAALAGERVYDGRLTVQEILQEWRLEADLVTLSACETGLGRQVQGEGLVGFAHAFLQVGARALLVSLWQVDDAATSLLMERFYANLWQHGLGKAAALQEAKAWLRGFETPDGRQPFAHPFYWSAFVLIGDRD